MAVYSNIGIDQGTDWSAEIVVEDAAGTVAVLTGYTGAGQIRKSYTSSTKVDFTVTVTNALKGILTIALSNTQTNAMKAGRYLYDIEITKTTGGEKTRVVEGQLTINPGVTQ
jgi:hypothetical protein